MHRCREGSQGLEDLGGIHPLSTLSSTHVTQLDDRLRKMKHTQDAGAVHCCHADSSYALVTSVAMSLKHVNIGLYKRVDASSKSVGGLARPCTAQPIGDVIGLAMLSQ